MERPTNPDPASPPAQKGWIARTSATVIRRLLRLRVVRAALLYTGRRGPMLADAVTYRALFSVFAAVLLGFSAAALWLSQDAVAWRAVVSAVDSAVPGLIATGDEKGIVELDMIDAPGGLSVAGVISLIGLIGSALGAIGSMRNAVRTIAGTDTADVVLYLVLLRSALLALIIGATFVAAAALTFAGELVVGWFAGIVGVASDAPAVFWTVRVLSLVIVFALDTVLIAAVYRMLSGVRASRSALWGGAALGGVGLLVLQELSGLFVGGAKANPLLASFASLLALLLWLNLSTQVILLASALITISHREQGDRVAERFGAETLPEFALRQAEDDVRAATAHLRAAQQAAAPD
ncbi:YhjD/YihY/BrkB family envelope integrity protein [Microbacterium sp. NPDC077391]|uniref:YihY/virulence factor BrkB family protein n=1 Tax=Microbacterium commune TaxID=2762219 RepID=A0ABR8W2B5_9MICO|nr:MULTISPECIES: YhjD/YihY/BrkB family envelope integrity protein [Microbacterium]MBD8010886.1 YihY/virulence factor BrkB family protein [Microbacterium commune]